MLRIYIAVALKLYPSPSHGGRFLALDVIKKTNKKNTSKPLRCIKVKLQNTERKDFGVTAPKPLTESCCADFSYLPSIYHLAECAGCVILCIEGQGKCRKNLVRD